MKTSIKREKNECLVITLKHVNRLGTPKLWAIAHENGEFLVIPLNTYRVLSGVQTPVKPQNCGQ